MAKTVKIAKTDAKKAAKKAAAELQKKLEATVKAAYDVDPTTALAPFLARPFSKNGIDAVATVSTVKQLSADDKKWIWKLLEGNMRPVFGEKVWKAREGKEKKNDMVDDDARYIIVRRAPAVDPENTDPNGVNTDTSGEPLGFVHYRFVIEEDVAVMYVYELQLDAAAHRKGLGKYLMMLCDWHPPRWRLRRRGSSGPSFGTAAWAARTGWDSRRLWRNSHQGRRTGRPSRSGIGGVLRGTASTSPTDR